MVDVEKVIERAQQIAQDHGAEEIRFECAEMEDEIREMYRGRNRTVMIHIFDPCPVEVRTEKGFARYALRHDIARLRMWRLAGAIAVADQMISEHVARVREAL